MKMPIDPSMGIFFVCLSPALIHLEVMGCSAHEADFTDQKTTGLGFVFAKVKALFQLCCSF